MKTIRVLIVAGMVLLPSMATAVTKCWVNEFVDHREAVCIGDEKPLPVSEPNYALPQTAQSVPTQNQASPQPPMTAQSAETGTMSSPSQANSTQGIPSQTGATQTASVVHRQGRQQYQQAMEEARAARQQLISQLQQMQQNQAQ